MRVALSGLTMAEYFRDRENQDVLLSADRYADRRAGIDGLHTADQPVRAAHRNAAHNIVAD